MSYRARINVLHIEDNKGYEDLYLALASHNVYWHRVETLEEAKKVLSSVAVDMVVSDGMFPFKAGMPEAPSFLFLHAFMQKKKMRIPVVVWSSSVRVHTYCKKNRVASYSKQLLISDSEREAKLESLRIQKKTGVEMADIVLTEFARMKNFLKKTKFEFMYEEPATMLGLSLAFDVRTGYFQKTAGSNYGAVIAEVTNQLVSVYIDSVSEKRIAGAIYKKMLQGPFFKKMTAEIRKRARALLTHTHRVKKISFSRKSNAELSRMYSDFCNLFLTMRMYSSLPTAMEHQKNPWSELLMGILEKKNCNLVERNEIMSVLTSPSESSYIEDFHKKLASLGLAEEAGKNVRARLDRILKDFAWIRYTFSGMVLSEQGIREEMRGIQKQYGSYRTYLEKMKTKKTMLRAQKSDYIKRAELTRHEAELYAKGASIVYLKFFRKGVFAQAYYEIEFLLHEIGKRIGVSQSDVANMFPQEVLASLVVGAFPAELITARMKGSLCVSTRGMTMPIDRALWKSHRRDVLLKETAIRGQVAFSGKAEGIAKIVNTSADVSKVHAGDILISRSTNPSLIIAMQKAGAFVTDTGGLTCHAAIVAREMKKPCIVGTKNATHILKDGDRVYVDATIGEVKKV